ncbi:MAG: MiaB/RimO family radical SAM methylthiotransferase, partial [Oscillospiraceae bacterium]
RGRECSREPQNIVNEVKELVSQGYKEITLLGQNVNSYGKKLETKVNFSDLLVMLNDIDGDFRIRFMTSHPKDCTHELIDTIAECPKVCNHIHLPVQSGSNRVLKAMNRHYDTEKYLELIDYAKSKIKDVSFTSDIIVGFPGETYDDFLETIQLIKKVRFEALYKFIYSKRVGTPAAEFEDVATDGEKSAWFRELMDIQEKIEEEMFEEKIGKTYDVLAEDFGKTEDGFVTGRTEGNVIVEFKGSKDDMGKFVKVKITKALHWCLIGVRI